MKARKLNMVEKKKTHSSWLWPPPTHTHTEAVECVRCSSLRILSAQEYCSVNRLNLDPCQSCLCYNCAIYRHPHGLSPVPLSPPTLWTKLNAELKPTPYPHHNMAHIPDPTEKLQASSSHNMPAPLSKCNPNSTRPPLISTSRPTRKLADHTSIWSIHQHTPKNVITRAQIAMETKLNELTVTGISTPPTQPHKTDGIVCLPWLLIPACSLRTQSLKRTGNKKQIPLRWGMGLCN